MIGAEVLTRIVDWTDRNTCCLFGDGAGAVVLEAVEGDHGILSTHIHSDGTYWELLNQPGVGNRHPACRKTLDDKLMYINMQGNEVFKLAVRAMDDVAHEALSTNSLSTADIDLFIPHQANRRIIDAIGKRLGLADDQVTSTLSVTATPRPPRFRWRWTKSIARAADERGTPVMLDAFGGGLTWGAALVRW